jgi:pimeloyl-ACP methyl ester carboxylesterase
VVESLVLQEAPPVGPEPVVVGATSGPLLGFYHAPASRSGAPRGIGVVLCNPLGYEAMCAHRAYRHLAMRLAERGFPALRFDYHGTGDSSGYSDEPGRVEAWLASIDAAIGELRERAGVRSVGLFGVRFGATLAAMAAARRGDVDSLILWAPVPSGRAYVRELRAFRMIKQAGEKPEGAPNGAPGEGEEAAGYYFDKATVADLSALDLLAAKERMAPRALLVPRDDLPGNEARLEKHFRQLGMEVRLTSDSGYTRMMRDAQESVVPDATLDGMIDWLDATKHHEARFILPPKSARNVLNVKDRASRVSVREQCLRFGDGQRLFGIASEARDTVLPANRPAILFLNVGANHHVGPNRMYVTLGRDLAARGYLAFRFDVAGLGDSQVAPGGQENRLHTKESVGDIRTAMTFLTEKFGVHRFVLVGLCSGAWLAFHTCIEDLRVAGQILLNPQKLDWREGDSLEISMRKSFGSNRFYARALFDKAVWRRAIRGQVNVRAVMGIIRERLATRGKSELKGLIARLRGRVEPQTEIEQAFHAVSRRGVDSLMVFSFSDGGLDHMEEHLGPGARKMRAHRSFHLEILDGADHTFTPIPSQVALHDLLVSHLSKRFP